jgi:hypothetical protein
MRNLFPILVQALLSMIKFVSEGITELFSPNHDHYPATGTVPYSGMPYRKTHWTRY